VSPGAGAALLITVFSFVQQQDRKVPRFRIGFKSGAFAGVGLLSGA
jgi:hypothetical protein